MIVTKNIEVPTGNIVCVEGEKGLLEFVSVGDYGKNINLKADFLGLESEPAAFKHTDMLPLTEKWVVTISTQYGCAMNCTFCDAPKAGKGANATYADMMRQIHTALSLHPEITKTERLNIHFARMGEPSFNMSVIDCAIGIKDYLGDHWNIHPVVSTMMPKNNKRIHEFVFHWMEIKNELYGGNAGLQISINSTSESERNAMFSGNCLTFPEIHHVMAGAKPLGRKITLSFAVAGYEIDPSILLKYFNPDQFLVKLTPMHKTVSAEELGIVTGGDFTEYHPYREHEEALKAAGYDVIVFLASEYEDMGRITCGNAILSGTVPEVPYRVLFDRVGIANNDDL